MSECLCRVWITDIKGDSYVIEVKASSLSKQSRKL